MIDALRPCYELDIETGNALLPGLNIDKIHQQSLYASDPLGVFFIEDFQTILNKDWTQHLESLGLFVSSCVLFYRDPEYQRLDAHVDLQHKGSICYYGCNFVLDPNDDAYMVWYDATPDTGIFTTEPNNEPHLYWPIEKVIHKEIFRKCIGRQLTIVNTSIPHNIVMGKLPRWCISIRFSNPVSSWEQAVDLFKNHIK
jgi:hypothetical protein